MNFIGGRGDGTPSTSARLGRITTTLMPTSAHPWRAASSSARGAPAAAARVAAGTAEAMRGIHPAGVYEANRAGDLLF